MTESIAVEPMQWSTQFIPWVGKAWKPGEHFAIIAPTGAGKTTFAAGILSTRRYVVSLDAKGGDTTLSKMGYRRLPSWPGQKQMDRLIENDEKHNRESRYIIGSAGRTKKEAAALQQTLKSAVSDIYEMGGWTVYADELMILTDPRQFNLRGDVDQMLIAARDRGISVVSSFQTPRYVTPTASNQATWVAVSRTRDVDVVNRLGEILGRPKAEIRGAMKGLDRYSWLVVGRDPHEPIRVTISEDL
jgi:hypothetical protein